MGKLDETNNFLDLFCHAAGESEVPRDFIFWAGMSLLASCVADRVWMEPDAGRKVTPNLYVFLLGPSGTGKEYAVHAAGKYAAKEPTINVYGGMATSQFLLKYLARRHKSDHQVWAFVNTKLYFITEELGMCTRPGEQAHDLVTTMTGLYKGAPYPFRKGTVSGDDLMIPNPCLTGDVEVLTLEGWCRLDALKTEQPIMQWNSSRQCSWVIPKQVVLPFTGDLLGWREELHDCFYTPTHRMPVISEAVNQSIRDTTAQDRWEVGEFQIPITGQYQQGTQHAPDLIRLIAAVQADGCIADGYVQIELKLPRKIQRLRNLLKRLHIDGHERRTRGGSRAMFSIYAKDAKPLLTLLGHPKRFGAWLLNFDFPSLCALVDEVVWWDGHESRQGGARNGYSSKFFENASWVATIAHLTGQSAYLRQRPSAWYVTIRKQAKTTLYRQHRKTQAHAGQVYCVTVPSSYFLVRSRGTIFVTGNCLNWLAGSTDDWLVKTIGRDAVMGGFTARLVTVRGRRNYAVRYPQMLFPEDLEEVKAHLEARVRGYTEAEGGLTLSEEARTIHDDWYLTRPAPTDEQNEPGFNKADEMVLRFATLLSLADWDAVAERDAPGIVEHWHMQRAIDLWDNVSAQTPEVIRLASSTVRSSQVDVVSNLCQKAGTIDRSSLTRKARYYGLDGDDIDRCVRTLIAQDSLLMHREPSPRGPARTIYTWQVEELYNGVDLGV